MSSMQELSHLGQPSGDHPFYLAMLRATAERCIREAGWLLPTLLSVVHEPARAEPRPGLEWTRLEAPPD